MAHWPVPSPATPGAVQVPDEWDDGTGLGGRDGLVWQAVAMAGYLEEGRLQSPVYPMSESIALARTLDEVEAQLRAAIRR